MCGIVGGISFTGEFFPRQTEIDKASSFLKFRGPDDHGDLFLKHGKTNLAFSHSRLSIIDLSSTGHQPMISKSGKTIIVFNGEIYNYQALKAELTKSGFPFNTKSDTEVILNGFECWGMEGTLERLDGMFAFALFDKNASSLFLARDRFGKKPLYYYQGDGRLAFGSDIRSFKGLNGVTLTINLHALGYFFAELSTPLEATIWNEVSKVKPGNYLEFNASGLMKDKRFWQLNYSEDCKLHQQAIIEKTEFLFGEAVKKRLVADVNVSALLSGGIDSSLVVAKMAEFSSKRVRTYSVGFDEDDFNELPYARQVAAKFNTEHTELIINSKNFNKINDLIMEYGEPFADASMIPTYLMSREISKTEKVVLGGDGGDELFGGYQSYYFTHKFDKVKNFGVASPLATAFSKIYPSYRTVFLHQLLKQAHLPKYFLLNRNFGFSASELKKLSTEEEFGAALDNEHSQIWNKYSPQSSSDLINVLSASLRTRLVNDYLVKIDRASMYASLEMRSPFLDRELAEFAATLKPTQLFNKSGTKSILKDIAEKHFTSKFIHRRKMGFAVPLGSWFRNDLNDNLMEIVLGGKQNLINLDYKFIEVLLGEHANGTNDHTHKIWSLYVFHIWAHNQ